MLRYHWSNPHYLQCDVAGFRGYTFHCFVIAAASTAVEDHAGRDIGVFRILWILLEDVHQHFPWLAHTLTDDVREKDDLIFTLVHSLVNAGSLYCG